MQKFKFSLLALFIQSSLSFAESPEADSLFDLTLEELGKITVVTAASGFEQKAIEAPANVTVITHEEWESRGARLLSDVLVSVPGVHAGKSANQYVHQKYTFRGMSGDSSAKIKFLIDGEPIYSLQSGGMYPGFNMPLSTFQRVEVIKGPGSAIYGADAFAGIVNLVTFDKESPQRFGGRLGSFDTYDIYGTNRFQLSDSTLDISLNYSKSNDDPNKIVESDLQTILDQALGTHASNAPGPISHSYEVFSLSAKWKKDNLAVDYFTWRNFDIGLAGGVAQALDDWGYSSVHYDKLSAEYNLSEYAYGDLRASVTYKKQDVRSVLQVLPDGAVLPIGADGNLTFTNPTTVALFTDGYIGTPSQKGETFSYRLTHLFHATDNHFIRWELGYEHQNFRPSERKNFGPGVLDGSETIVTGTLTDVTNTPYIYITDIIREFYYLSLQDDWKVSNSLHLTLGARYDNYSDFGNSINPRVGIIWQANDDLTAKIFAGTAINSPSLAQLYAQNNPVSLGNADLKPEEVETIETGFSFEYLIHSDMIMSASFFKYHAKDLVEFVYQENRGAAVANNIGEQEGEGGEFIFKWKPQSNITVDANYSFVSSKNHLNEKTPDIPMKMAYLGVHWIIDSDWSMNMTGKWISDRIRFANDDREKLDDYALVTTRVARQNLIKGMTVALSVNNLFDTDAREPSGPNFPNDLPRHGRQVLLEANYQF